MSFVIFTLGVSKLYHPNLSKLSFMEIICM